MAAHVISVCVFCLICATHSPCGSHAAVAHESPQVRPVHDAENPTIFKREKFKEKDPWWSNSVLRFGAEEEREKEDGRVQHVINKRYSDDDVDVNNKDFYLKKLFAKYGDGKTITMDGFQGLLDHLFEVQYLSKRAGHEGASSESETNDTCLINNALVALSNSSSSNTNDTLNSTTLDAVCPAILYSLVSGSCAHNPLHLEVHDEDLQLSTAFTTWLYSMIAVFVISTCGVLSLLIIPVMQKKFYKPLLQFLVALAVGTLAGDALLHLLPHAMSSGHHHENGHEESHENMWKGFVAMLGLILFFVMERFIPLVHRWRHGKPTKGHSHVKVLSSGLDINKAADTQCKDKYNAYSRCYKDIVDDPNTTFLEAGETSNVLEELLNTRKKKPPKQNANNTKGDVSKPEPAIKKDKENGETNQNMTECPNELNASNNCTEVNKMLPHIEVPVHEEPEADYTVILTEHGAQHHGHSHLHGHVHAAPQNFSSVAWMVIMGDGLHNFTDGMAIGAAFSGSVAGGFSTAVAVFCHELPHEVGDFAMLLKAGMSIKQALFYNIISSILCILGNLLGVWLGNTEAASSWVFAVAAGTFIYIALVDMIPELSSAHEDEGNLIQSILHLSGLLLGFGIMTLIALYEHDLKNMFKD